MPENVCLPDVFIFIEISTMVQNELMVLTGRFWGFPNRVCKYKHYLFLVLVILPKVD